MKLDTEQFLAHTMSGYGVFIATTVYYMAEYDIGQQILTDAQAGMLAGLMGATLFILGVIVSTVIGEFQ